MRSFKNLGFGLIRNWCELSPVIKDNQVFEKFWEVLINKGKSQGNYVASKSGLRYYNISWRNNPCGSEYFYIPKSNICYLLLAIRFFIVMPFGI